MGQGRRERDRRDAEARVLRFYWTLHQLLRPFDRELLTLEVARRLNAVSRALRTNPNLIAQWLPFRLLHAMEAAAAHSGVGQGCRPTDGDLQNLLNHYRRYNDPTDRFLIEECGLPAWLMRVDREQFQIQFEADHLVLGRLVRLFWHEGRLAKTNSKLKSSYGFDIEEWITACFVVWSATARRSYPTVTPAYLKQIPPTLIMQEALLRCIAEMSLTPDGLANWYRERRPAGKPLTYALAEHAILTSPLVRFEQGWVAPIPDLILVNASRAIHRMGRRVAGNEFSDEFGAALENYVHEALSGTPYLKHAVDGKQLKEGATRLSCDRALEFEDCIVLIECKAIQPTAKFFDADSIRRSPSTPPLARALSQIVMTARDVQGGRYGPLFDSGKPIFGLVVTAGRFVGTNSAWYHGILEPELDPDVRQFPKWYSPLQSAPQILDLGSLERFSIWLHQHAKSPMALFQQKTEYDRSVGGDWDRFLDSEVSNKPNPIKPFFEAPFDELWRQRFESVLPRRSEEGF